MSGPPATAYQPGTRLTVGSHQVVVQKYLSQGGFADVYACTMSPAWGSLSVGCLKRVRVPAKPMLNVLRQEVEAMRRLKGRRYIVSYIDSNASREQTGQGYVVLLLMEYCSRKGLIDFMNSRLVNKLTEPEILEIMGDITEAVACCHSLTPPIVHRDIKIENVLLADNGSYKLCDFGSASPPLPAAQNVEEFQILQDDILRHTTPQYRSPEMVDLYRRQPIDEKSDVWALGVMLYKLCYYTTPFEKNAINGNGNGGGGEYAIVNGLFSFPPSPPFSARLKNVVAKTLAVNPAARPNVFQLLDEICKMRGIGYPQAELQAAVASQPQQVVPQTQQVSSQMPVPVRPSVHPHLPSKLTQSAGSLAKPTSNPIASYKSAPNVQEMSSVKSGGLTRYQSVLQRPQLPHNKSSHSLSSIKSRTAKRRPVSLSATEFERLNSESLVSVNDLSPIQTLITGMTAEETVDLSPNHHTNIDSSVEFLRDLTGQSSASSEYARQPAPRSKRSSMSSIKDLLHTGRRGGAAQPRRVSHRSMRSVSSKVAALNSNAAENGSSESLLDFARTSKSPTDPVGPSVPSSHPPKRANSIQRRVKMLLGRHHSPPPKTASGYGKYTEKPAALEPAPDLSASSVPRRQLSVRRAKTAAPQLPAKPPSMVSESSLEQADPFSNVPELEPGSLQSSRNGSIYRKKSKMAPPKPKKPSYLRSPGQPGHRRQVSDASSLYNEDFDVLEKRFEERFPSAV